MLPTLPEELLSHIFGYLALPSATELADAAEGREGPYITNHELFVEDMQLDQQSLFNVCLVSKNFYRLAWPTLYRAHTTWLMGQRFMYPSSFLRTLCLKPEYGDTLRSFSIRDWDTIQDIDIEVFYDDCLNGDAMTMAAFQWRARNFWLKGYEGGQKFQDRLVRSLMIGMPDGLVCMILLMCPNITELDISLPWGGRTSCLIAELCAVITSPQTEQPPSDIPAYQIPSSRYVTSQLLGISWPDTPWRQPGALEFLSEFTLRGGDETQWEPLLTSVTLLPSLKTLRIYNLVKGPSRDWLAAITRRKAPQLRTLHLPECCLGDTGLCDIVRLFPHLRTLNIDWSVMYSGLMSMKDIGRAVAQYTPRLMHLTLDASLCRIREDSFGEDRRMENTLCDSIKNMQHLERLKVNDQAIWSQLPLENGRGFETELRNLEPAIRHALPTHVAWLEIVFPRHPELYWEDHNLCLEYRRWQDHDLRTLLLDEPFTELKRVDSHGCKREVYTGSVRERGWLHREIVTEGGANVERLSWLEMNGELGAEFRTENII